MMLGDALVKIQDEEYSAMRLPHWGPDVLIKVQRPDEHSKMTAPYLYVESRKGLVPWIPTMIEMFSESWGVVK